MAWLREHFVGLPADADDDVVQQYARAYILMLMGASTFADKSGNEVQVLYLPILESFDVAAVYSWGSATLAYLYRQLCRGCHRDGGEMGGFLLLIQLWSWEHIHIGRPVILRYHGIDGGPLDDDMDQHAVLGPHHVRGEDPLGRRWLFAHVTRTSSAAGLGYYRDALDRLCDDQMTWMPYTDEILGLLPPVAREHTEIWRARVPLICFDVVEHHFPDRVLRQFGLQQITPRPCDTSVDLHKIDRRGKHTEDWGMRHIQYITMWDERAAYIVDGIPSLVPTASVDYMRWYYTITRVFISPSFRLPTDHYQPSSVALHMTTRALRSIHDRATAILDEAVDVQGYHDACSGIVSLCADVLGRVDYGYMATSQHSTASTSAAGSSQAVRRDRVVLQPRNQRRRPRAQPHEL
ncbi:unnamed protein product, partial [Cuscuta epithymum]